MLYKKQKGSKKKDIMLMRTLNEKTNLQIKPTQQQHLHVHLNVTR